MSFTALGSYLMQYTLIHAFCYIAVVPVLFRPNCKYFMSFQSRPTLIFHIIVYRL